MSMNSLSIVIRTYGPEYLLDILKAIDKQEIGGCFIREIIIINGDKTYDWKSSDYSGSRKIIFYTNTHVPYRPGQALNTGISFTTGEIVVFLSGHSVPLNSKWLGLLISNFSDKNVVGVCGAQKPRLESNWIEKLYRIVWYGFEPSGNMFKQFNMANSALRKFYWQEYKFNETLEGCEDRHWSRVIRERYGVSFKFAQDSVVLHSHINSVPETLKYFLWLFQSFVKSYIK